MKAKQYEGIAALIFGIVAVAHLLRVLYGWPAEIGGMQVPMWASWLAVFVAGYLSVQGMNLTKSR